MMYSLHDLLLKMGAPEAREKGRMEWHYFDRKKNALAGFAEIRLEAGGERLVAEMRHIRENHTDDDGKTHSTYTESFYFHAERTARPAHYRVTKISLDGDDYNQPQKGIVELGLSVFHARALDISVRMVEQVFNKQDILTPPPETDIVPKMRMMAAAAASPQKREEKKEEWGVVIPFRPRTPAIRANA